MDEIRQLYSLFHQINFFTDFSFTKIFIIFMLNIGGRPWVEESILMCCIHLVLQDYFGRGSLHLLYAAIDAAEAATPPEFYHTLPSPSNITIVTCIVSMYS